MAYTVERFGDIPIGGSKYAYISEPPILLVCPATQQHSVMMPEIDGRPVSSAGILINFKNLMVQPSGSSTLKVPARSGEAQAVIQHIQSLPGAGSKTVFQSKH